MGFLPSANIDVIPNGVDLDRFYPAPAGELPAKLKLVTVGRLSATKRIEMLIDAMEILSKKGADVSLRIAGGGGMAKQLKEMAEQRKLAGIIKFAGRVGADKMPDTYRQNHIFFSASMQEGMSNAMLEAMASGLPIITTRCEGLEELISDNGIVVENDSAESLAEAVIRLAGNRQQYKTMCIAARRRAETFGWDKVADGYIKLYQRVLGRK
jgi:glycosyltransferase involved in cell wall biosynthesis